MQRAARYRQGKPVPAAAQVPKPAAWRSPLFLLLLLAGLLSGCATSRRWPLSNSRPFDFSRDTFAYNNELVWAYRYDPNGQRTTHEREPKPTYTQHCFVVARSARQFFEHARFDPGLPVADEGTYRRLIRQVVTTNPRKPLPEAQTIVIPGYADLRAFSQAHERLLKAECGGISQCYFQRGNWRMILPFSRRQQERTAEQLLARLRQNRPPVIHVVRFPQLTINHAVAVFDAKETGEQIQFLLYDPNQCSEPSTLTYDRATRTFHFPPSPYFPGGRVEVYEIYHRWNS